MFLYSTTPVILAFSSIAYTDIVAASTQLAAMFAFTLCLEAPDWKHTLGLGLVAGLALLAQLTAVIFVPAAVICITIVWFIAHRETLSLKQLEFKKLLAALALCLLIVWAGYGFSLRPLDQSTGIAASAVGDAAPQPFRNPFRAIILGTLRYPAPPSNLLLTLGWIVLVLAGNVAMFVNPDFRAHAREHLAEMIFLAFYLPALYSYNALVLARSAFPRFAVAIVSFVFLALSRWLPAIAGCSGVLPS